MNRTTSSGAPATTHVGSHVPVSSPGHVRRWTGRSALTIPLPSLAALRLSLATDTPRGSPASLMRT